MLMFYVLNTGINICGKILGDCYFLRGSILDMNSYTIYLELFLLPEIFDSTKVTIN